MHTLARNRKSFYYALYSGKSKVYKDNLYTGQETITYAAPVEAKMNISPSLGRAELESFCITEGYTHTIVTDDMSCPIDEKTIIWYGVETTTNYNYVVIRKAVALNHIIYALQKVSGDYKYTPPTPPTPPNGGN